jgi:competence protein ComFC
MREMRNLAINYHTLISGFLNILYPSQCPACGNPSDAFHYSPICSSCWSTIKRFAGPSCAICALPCVSEYVTVCGQCMKKKPPFSKAIFYGIYDGVLAEAISQMKFYGLKRLSKPLGTLLLNCELPVIDGILPVPLSVKGLRERGFNQSLLMAKVLSKNLQVPLFMDILSKKKETLPQIGLSKKERSTNLKKAFEVKGDIKGLRLLLIDDVMTTGATVTECSKVLMNAGAQEVIVLTLARAGEP